MSREAARESIRTTTEPSARSLNQLVRALREAEGYLEVIRRAHTMTVAVAVAVAGIPQPDEWLLELRERALQLHENSQVDDLRDRHLDGVLTAAQQIAAALGQ